MNEMGDETDGKDRQTDGRNTQFCIQLDEGF